MWFWWKWWRKVPAEKSSMHTNEVTTCESMIISYYHTTLVYTSTMIISHYIILSCYERTENSSYLPKFPGSENKSIFIIWEEVLCQITPFSPNSYLSLSYLAAVAAAQSNFVSNKGSARSSNGDKIFTRCFSSTPLPTNLFILSLFKKYTSRKLKWPEVSGFSRRKGFHHRKGGIVRNVPSTPLPATVWHRSPREKEAKNSPFHCIRSPDKKAGFSEY